MEIGEVIGWRAWRVVEEKGGARLASVLYEDRWPIDGPLEARCEHGHRAPAYDCTCGIYAAKERRLALPYRIGRNDPQTLGRVLGLAVLGGDVIEHRDGWRGSHARPLEIWAPPALAEALAQFRTEWLPGRFGETTLSPERNSRPTSQAANLRARKAQRREMSCNNGFVL